MVLEAVDRFQAVHIQVDQFQVDRELVDLYQVDPYQVDRELVDLYPVDLYQVVQYQAVFEQVALCQGQDQVLVAVVDIHH